MTSQRHRSRNQCDSPRNPDGGITGHNLVQIQEGFCRRKKPMVEESSFTWKRRRRTGTSSTVRLGKEGRTKNIRERDKKPSFDLDCQGFPPPARWWMAVVCVCPRAGRHHAIVGRRVVGWLLLLFALSDTLNQMHARISATLERAKRRSTTWFRLSRKCTVLHTSGMMANCTMVTAKKTRTAELFPLLDFGTHRHSVDPVIMSPMGSCC